MGAANLEEFYTFGDVYETLDTCDQLDVLLRRLRRQNFLSEPDCAQSRERVASIRDRLESYVSEARLVPKGPFLR